MLDFPEFCVRQDMFFDNTLSLFVSQSFSPFLSMDGKNETGRNKIKAHYSESSKFRQSPCLAERVAWIKSLRQSEKSSMPGHTFKSWMCVDVLGYHAGGSAQGGPGRWSFPVSGLPAVRRQRNHGYVQIARLALWTVPARSRARQPCQ